MNVTQAGMKYAENRIIVEYCKTREEFMLWGFYRAVKML